MAQTQKVLRFSQPGPVSTSLSLTDAPIPSVSPHQALIRIHASAINPSDILNVEGKFQQTTFASHGRVPGRDFAGIVVTGPKQFENKRVWGTGGVNGFVKDGTHAEYIVVEEEVLADMGMPEGMTFSQAAACGIGFLTAATMVEKAAPKSGEHVLVLGLWLSIPALSVKSLMLTRFLGGSWWRCHPALTIRRSYPNRDFSQGSLETGKHHRRLTASDRASHRWRRYCSCTRYRG